MVVLGLSLRFIQETKADNAAAKLKAMIKVTATVIRDGQAKEIPLKQLVPGDVVKLVRRRHDSRRRAADFRQGLVHHPGHADRRIHAGGKNRRARSASPMFPPSSTSNICFLGTSVESGSATAVIVATGAQTYFGKMAQQPGRPAGRDGV